MSKKIIWAIIITVILAGAVSAYFLGGFSRVFDCCHGEQYDTANSPVADWKTYHNERHGFEFKYPNTFEVIPDTSGMNPGMIYVLHPEDRNFYAKTDGPLDGISINIKENKERLSVTDWWYKYGPYAEENNQMGLRPDSFPIEKMIVGDKEGIYIGGSEGILTNYLILAQGDKIFEINLMAGDSMKILSTFKFTK